MTLYTGCWLNAKTSLCHNKEERHATYNKFINNRNAFEKLRLNGRWSISQARQMLFHAACAAEAWLELEEYRLEKAGPHPRHERFVCNTYTKNEVLGVEQGFHDRLIVNGGSLPEKPMAWFVETLEIMAKAFNNADTTKWDV